MIGTFYFRFQISRGINWYYPMWTFSKVAILFFKNSTRSQFHIENLWFQKKNRSHFRLDVWLYRYRTCTTVWFVPLRHHRTTTLCAYEVDFLVFSHQLTHNNWMDRKYSPMQYKEDLLKHRSRSHDKHSSRFYVFYIV